MTTEPIVRELVMNSRCKWGEFKLWTIVEDQLILTMEQTSEEFLREELWTESEDFYIVLQIVKHLWWDWEAWKEFIKNCRIENWKLISIWVLKHFENTDFTAVDSRVQSYFIDKINKKEIDIGWNKTFGWLVIGMKEVLKNKTIPWNLIIGNTDAKSMENVEKVDLDLDLQWFNYLKNIGNLSYVHGDIKAVGANIDLQIDILEKIRKWKLSCGKQVQLWGNIEWLDRLLQNKFIWWSLDLSNTGQTSIWEVEEIEWPLKLSWLTDFDLWNLSRVRYTCARWYDIDIQVDIIKRINEGSLLTNGEDEFWYPPDGVEKFLQFDRIPWNLYLDGTDLEIQSKIKEKFLSWELKVDWIVFFDEGPKRFKEFFF